MEWQEAQYSLAYGLPLRVGQRSLAAPAEGDDGTVALWSELLEVALPQIVGCRYAAPPSRRRPWRWPISWSSSRRPRSWSIRPAWGATRPGCGGLVTHIASLDLFRRQDPARLRDLDGMYQLLASDKGPKAMSARDYDPDLELRDWFWFQAQFHGGAQVILQKTGKGALKKLKKLKKKDGTLRAERLFNEFKGLQDWFRDSFAAVSLRTD